MSEVLIRKDGSQSIANESGIGVNASSIEEIVAEHLKLRDYGFHTGQVSSGAVLEGLSFIVDRGWNPDEFNSKLKAMIGLSSHFSKWSTAAMESGLLVASSLSTAIELEDSEEGKQIRGGMGEALSESRVLLVANFHDEANPREMDIYERMRVESGKLLRTESEENDFHAANIALAVRASTLMLCTMAEGFIYRGKKLDRIHVDDVDACLDYIDRTQPDDSKVVRKGGMRTKLEAAKAFILESAKDDREVRVAIGHSACDSRRIIEDNAGTWVVQ